MCGRFMRHWAIREVPKGEKETRHKPRPSSREMDKKMIGKQYWKCRDCVCPKAQINVQHPIRYNGAT